MDEKYIENVGQSSAVDEGLWDRLKSRASSFAQGAANLSGGKLGAVGSTESAKINSLFRGFVAEELSIIKSFDKAIMPWVEQMTPEEISQIQAIEDLEKALKIIDLEKLPIREALPSFGNLGAKWSGSVQNMINSYKKRMSDTYDSLVNDIKKLNIVPEQYIQRKLTSLAPEVMQKLGVAIGKPLGSTPAAPARVLPSRPTTLPPAATTPPTPAPEPAAPAPAPTSTPTAVPPKTPDPADSGTMLAPIAKAAASGSPEKTPVVAPVSEPPKTTPAASPEADGETDPSVTPKSISNSPYKTLIPNAVDKIIYSLTSGDMVKTIGGYIKRDANKAEAVFPAKPVVDAAIPTGNMIWHLRYRNSREARNHFIQVFGEVRRKNPETGQEEVVKKASQWENFMQFGAKEVVDNFGNPKTDFDIARNITDTNPVFGQQIKELEIAFDETKNEKIAQAFRKIVIASMPDSERGDRELNKAVLDDPVTVASGPETPTAPLEGPSVKEPMEKPSPERRSRTVQTEPSSPKTKATSAKKTATKSKAKTVSKPAAKKEEPPKAVEPEKPVTGGKAIPKEKYADYLKAKATKERELGENKIPSLKDFFLL